MTLQLSACTLRALPGISTVAHGSSVEVGVEVVLGHVGHTVGGAQVGHGGGGVHVTGGGQVHSSHSAQQLSQAGGSGHTVGSHVSCGVIAVVGSSVQQQRVASV
jgi:hypothetical protein